MHAGHDVIKAFVLDYLSLLEASVEEVEPDLFRVELDREKAAELETGSMPAWMWTTGPDGPAQITYYFTFSPKVAERHPEAELVGPNSYRLQQVIESVRRIANATSAHLPLDPSSQIPGAPSVHYRPFYFLCLRVDHLSGWTGMNELFQVAVDRVDRLPLRQLAELFPRLPLVAGRPKGREIPVEEPACDLAGAFLIAYGELLETLQRADASWAKEALKALADERDRLAGYYEACRREGQDVEEERRHRLDELEKMRPRTLVRLQGACEAYLPVRLSAGSVEHLALHLSAWGPQVRPLLERRHSGIPMPLWR